MKFLIMGPISHVLLIRVLIHEAAARRRERRQSHEQQVGVALVTAEDIS